MWVWSSPCPACCWFCVHFLMVWGIGYFLVHVQNGWKDDVIWKPWSCVPGSVIVLFVTILLVGCGIIKVHHLSMAKLFILMYNALWMKSYRVIPFSELSLVYSLCAAPLLPSTVLFFLHSILHFPSSIFFILPQCSPLFTSVFPLPCFFLSSLILLISPHLHSTILLPSSSPLIPPSVQYSTVLPLTHSLSTIPSCFLPSRIPFFPSSLNNNSLTSFPHSLIVSRYPPYSYSLLSFLHLCSLIFGIHSLTHW